MNNPAVVIVFKIMTLLFWVLVIAHIISPISGENSNLIVMAGAAILIFHAFEAVLFLFKFKQYSNNVPLDAVLIVVFGVIHFMPMLQKAQDEQNNPESD